MRNSSITVGIVSLGFSGSTVLSMVFDNDPNVFAIGESHWIRDRVNFSAENMCEVCNGPCNMIDAATQEKMSNNLDQWWNIAAKETGSKIILASDKRLVNYDLLGHPNKVIVMWKDPYAWIRSYIVHRKKRMEVGLALWSNQYKNIIKWVLDNEIDFEIVSLERFVDDTHIQGQKIADFIGCDWNDEYVNNLKSGHMIGGNPMAQGINCSLDHKKVFTGGVKKDERWRDFLNEEQIEIIKKHKSVQYMRNYLEKYSL